MKNGFTIGETLGYSTVAIVMIALAPVFLALAIIGTILKVIIGGPNAIKGE